jgi:hypothetical protein
MDEYSRGFRHGIHGGKRREPHGLIDIILTGPKTHGRYVRENAEYNNGHEDGWKERNRRERNRRK